MSLKDKILDKLREVIDPELGVDIVSLGFIYDVKVQSAKCNLPAQAGVQSHGVKLKNCWRVKIVMTLTTAGCPLAGVIAIMVRDKVKEIDGVDKVEVELTFDPPWTPEMMSEEARLKLGFSL